MTRGTRRDLFAANARAGGEAGRMTLATKLKGTPASAAFEGFGSWGALFLAAAVRDLEMVLEDGASVPLPGPPCLGLWDGVISGVPRPPSWGGSAIASPQ